MLDDREKIEGIWLQKTVPVIFRRGPGYPLLLRLPYVNGNYDWLRNQKHRKPKWLPGNKNYWELPASWFNDLVNRLLRRWGKLYIIQPHRKQEKCARACWEARGHECECSCLGEHHGSQNPSGKWFEVSDTFATKWQTKELACRLLKLN